MGGQHTLFDSVHGGQCRGWLLLDIEAGLSDEDTGTLSFQGWRSKARSSKQKSGVQFTTSRQISYKIRKLEVAQE